MEVGPPWANPKNPSSVHLFYEKIWNMVKLPVGSFSNADQFEHEFVDTSVLSTLLLTSGLTTGMLGYIWNLANNTVPGVLTQHELYCVLGLVGLAQRGRDFKSLDELRQIPVPPIPKLDLSIVEQMKTLNTVAVHLTEPVDSSQTNDIKEENDEDLVRGSFSAWRDPTTSTQVANRSGKPSSSSSLLLSGVKMEVGVVQKKKKKKKKKCISYL